MKKRVGEIDLNYEVSGHGPAVLLLHGFALDSRMWADNIAALEKHFRVVRFDFRGAGQSELGHEPFELTDLADDAAILLNQLGIPMAAVVGLSMGGYVALAFAQRHASRLSALVLADTRSAADTEQGKTMRDQTIALIEQYGSQTFAQTIPEKLMAPDAPEALKARVRLEAAQPPKGLIAASRAMKNRPDRTAELEEIECPTLVVVGEKDILTPPAEAKAMASAIKGAKFLEIPGAGHMSSLEKPELFDAAVVTFLHDQLLAF